MDHPLEPLRYKRQAHDDTVFELRKELMSAVNERKAAALPLAIQLFNKIAAKRVPMTQLGDYSTKDEAYTALNKHNQVSNASESLDKIELLLTDPSSPLVSTLKGTSKYSTSKLPETLDAYRATVDSGDLMASPVDLNSIIRDHQNITKLDSEVEHINATISNVNRLIAEERGKLGR